MINRILRSSALPPLRLHPGEALLWQSAPSWRRVALDVFHIRIVAIYLGLLLVANGVSAHLQHMTARNELAASVPLLLAVAAGFLIVLFLSHATWRSIHYAITTDRVLLRFGVALVGTLSIPHRAIASVSVAIHADHAGDIPLQLRAGHSVSLLKTWPLVRPWRFTQAQPMLRGVPQAGPVATLLARAVAEACTPAGAQLAEAAD
jgi:uncharacterized integral membrane protein